MHRFQNEEQSQAANGQNEVLIIKHPEKKVLWTSMDGVETSFETQLDSENSFISIQMDKIGDWKDYSPPSSIVIVEYTIKRSSDDSQGLPHQLRLSPMWCSSHSPMACVITATISSLVLALLVMVIPPAICTLISKRYLKKRWNNYNQNITRSDSDINLLPFSQIKKHSDHQPVFPHQIPTMKSLYEVDTMVISSGTTTNSSLISPVNPDSEQRCIEQHSAETRNSRQSTPQSVKPEKKRNCKASTASLTTSSTENGAGCYYLEDDYCATTSRFDLQIIEAVASNIETPNKYLSDLNSES